MTKIPGDSSPFHTRVVSFQSAGHTTTLEICSMLPLFPPFFIRWFVPLRNELMHPYNNRIWCVEGWNQRVRCQRGLLPPEREAHKSRQQQRKQTMVHLYSSKRLSKGRANASKNIRWKKKNTSWGNCIGGINKCSSGMCATWIIKKMLLGLFVPAARQLFGGNELRNVWRSWKCKKKDCNRDSQEMAAAARLAARPVFHRRPAKLDRIPSEAKLCLCNK